MKIILAFSLILLTATAPLLAQQKLKRRPGTLYVLGPARTIRIERVKITSINGEFVEGPRVLITTVAFSEDGTNVVGTNHREDGRLVGRTAETYDPDGRLLEAKSFDGGGVLKTHLVNTYDAKKHLIEFVTFRGDGSMSIHAICQYQGEQKHCETTAYDNRGGVQRVTNADLTVVGQPTAGEDLRERRSDVRSYGVDGIISTRSSIASKPDGNQEYKLERSDGTWQRAVNTPEGTTNYDRDGSILSRQRAASEYDSYGNLLKITKLVAKGDSQNFAPTEVTYRTITYYGKTE
jgi:hypothetical protein